MRIRRTNYSRVTKKTRRQLTSLTRKQNSGMRDYIVGGIKDYPIIIASENGKVLGWVLITGKAVVTGAHVYVRRAARRQGIGTKLLEFASKEFKFRVAYKCAPEFFDSLPNGVVYNM